MFLRPRASVRTELGGGRKASFNQEIHSTFLNPSLLLAPLPLWRACVETEVLNYPGAVRQKHLVGF